MYVCILHVHIANSPPTLFLVYKTQSEICIANVGLFLIIEDKELIQKFVLQKLGL